jgi:high-affinity Fe2+/Pb2+ permease
MKQLIQARVGMIAIIAGIVGTMFGVGGVENSVTTEQLIASVGVAVTSLMLMYAGVQLIKAAE